MAGLPCGLTPHGAPVQGDSRRQIQRHTDTCSAATSAPSLGCVSTRRSSSLSIAVPGPIHEFGLDLFRRHRPDGARRAECLHVNATILEEFDLIIVRWRSHNDHEGVGVAAEREMDAFPLKSKEKIQQGTQAPASTVCRCATHFANLPSIKSFRIAPSCSASRTVTFPSRNPD